MDVIRKMYWMDIPVDNALDILLSRRVNITREQLEQLYHWYGREDECKCHYCTSGELSKMGVNENG